MKSTSLDRPSPEAAKLFENATRMKVIEMTNMRFHCTKFGGFDTFLYELYLRNTHIHGFMDEKIHGGMEDGFHPLMVERQGYLVRLLSWR